MTAEETGSESLGSMASALEALAHAPGGDGPAPLARGELIGGKYRIERTLGRGGMGTVYLARDLRLERDVALKLGSAVSADALARAVREARALARLSHPNVVVVHEVGEHGGRLYVAMEYVAGGNARAWLKAQPRSWREIVRLFAAAGDGLAAAHAAGLVHRDIKPDNLLVGRDGRPRVADFGLVRAEDGEGAADVVTADGDPAAEPAGGVTRTGTILGTLAYMPPEQLTGDGVDARADQFAFCAALWEALHGVRPFSGQNAETLRAEIARASPQQARRVPGHVEAALRRGLRADRAQRWPAMAPLLAALRRDPGQRWRRAGLALAAGGGLATVLLVGRSPAAHRDPCAGGAAELAATWSAARSASVRAALARQGKPWSAATADRVAAALDGWAARWVTQHRAVCEAGHGSWSPELHDRGVTCLARQRDALDATAEVLASADAATALRADAVVAALPSPPLCADAAYLTSSGPPPPGDAALAAAVAEQERALSRGLVLLAGGHIDEATAAVDGVAADAAGLPHPPLQARIRAARGSLALQRGDDAAALTAVRESYFASREHGDRITAARSATLGAFALIGLSRTEEAIDWARLGVSEASSTADPSLETETLRTLAAARMSHGDLAGARAPAEQAVVLARRASISQQASALQTLAYVEADEMRQAEALAALDEAVALLSAAYGADHPDLIGFHSERCLVIERMGRHDDAIAACQTALAIAEQRFGADSRMAATALGNLGAPLMRAGRTDEALAIIARSMAISRSAFGPDSNDVASDHNNRALLLADIGRLDEAVVDWNEARRIWALNSGPASGAVGLVEANLADAYWNAGRFAEAIAAGDRAIAIYEKTSDTRALSVALLARGASRRERGDVAGARRDLEQAYELRQGEDVDPYLRAIVEVELARAVAPIDVARARTLATAALDTSRRLDAPKLTAQAQAALDALDAPRRR